MPDVLHRLCTVTGCPHFSLPGSSRCRLHKNEQSKERKSASRRGYDRRHRRWRLAIISRHPICTSCGVRLSVVADHVRDLDTFAPGDPAAWSYDNGTGLCLTCHNKKSGRKGVYAMKEVSD